MGRPRRAVPSRRTRRARRRYRLLGGLAVATLALLVVYLCVRLSVVAVAREAQPVERLLAGALLGAELFLGIHAVGFFGSMLKATRHEAMVPPPAFSRHSAAPVAVLIAAFNEPKEVVEETLASVSAMDYPHFNLYLLDDSTRPECVEASRLLSEKYGVTLVRRLERAGFKAGAINDLVPLLKEPYVAILDADQKPNGSWLKEVVPHLEADPGLAFVQVPQVYVGAEETPVALAARYQQAVFFEYICEGKAVSNAMFCCGSNVVLRRAALESVCRVVEGRRHYFDETSVTEDFATSVELHVRGWRTLYVNRTHVVGLAPETLPAYFTQQMRWAMGTLGVGLRTFRRLLREPRALRPAQWWEYLLSGTYYFVGFANIIFMLTPIAFLLFDVRPVRIDAQLYSLVFVPYIAVAMNVFYLGMHLRGHRVRGVWQAAALSFSTFWIYARAGVVALLGLKRSFGVTPKGIGGAIPLRRLAVELGVFAACWAAVIVGAWRLWSDGIDAAVLINIAWAAYHGTILSTLFLHFNLPGAATRRAPLFAAAETPAA